MDPFGDQAGGGITVSFRFASQYAMADKTVDILLGSIAGPLCYAGPFGGGEVALEAVQQVGKHLRLALVDGNAEDALPEPVLG